MSKKSLSISSALMFILPVFPLLAGLTRLGNDIFTAVLNIRNFSPLIFGVLGLVAGLFGIKGSKIVSLVVLNLRVAFLTQGLYYFVDWNKLSP